MIRITLILPFQVSCLLVPVARVANKVQIVVIFCNVVRWLYRVIKLIYIYLNNFLVFHDEDCIVLLMLYSNSHNYSWIDFNPFSSIYLFLKCNGCKMAVNSPTLIKSNNSNDIPQLWT